VNIRRQVRGLAYRAFYGLPLPMRRHIARAVSPKYLVGAVTIIRDSEAAAPGRILLLRQPPGRGWGLPAGILKRRELPAVGAARELFEESGVRVEPGDLTPGNPNAIVHPNGGVVDTVWFGAVPASSTTLTVDGGEVIEARWFPADNLPDLTWPTARLLGVYGLGPRAGELPPSIPAGSRFDVPLPISPTSGSPTSGAPTSDSPASGAPASDSPTSGAPTSGSMAAGDAW
jgi:8-oxo-dGTP diphosphatase